MKDSILTGEEVDDDDKPPAPVVHSNAVVADMAEEDEGRSSPATMVRCSSTLELDNIGRIETHI